MLSFRNGRAEERTAGDLQRISRHVRQLETKGHRTVEQNETKQTSLRGMARKGGQLQREDVNARERTVSTREQTPERFEGL